MAPPDADHPSPPAEPAASPPAPPARSPHPAWAHRGVALLILGPTLALLLTAAALTPDADGYGTHTQLGLSPCGFKAATGLPCATCGMTTSFTLMADGRFVTALLVQPTGAILALLTAMAVIVSAWAVWSGMSLLPLAQALWRPAVILSFIGLMLAGWLFTSARTVLLP